MKNLLIIPLLVFLGLVFCRDLMYLSNLDNTWPDTFWPLVRILWIPFPVVGHLRAYYLEWRTKEIRKQINELKRFYGL